MAYAYLPAVLPEAPFAVLLPVSAAAIGAGGISWCVAVASTPRPDGPPSRTYPEVTRPAVSGRPGDV